MQFVSIFSQLVHQSFWIAMSTLYCTRTDANRIWGKQVNNKKKWQKESHSTCYLLDHTFLHDKPALILSSYAYWLSGNRKISSLFQPLLLVANDATDELIFQTYCTDHYIIKIELFDINWWWWWRTYHLWIFLRSKYRQFIISHSHINFIALGVCLCNWFQFSGWCCLDNAPQWRITCEIFGMRLLSKCFSTFIFCCPS